MQASETVNRIVTDYLAECTRLLANAKPSAGLFGLGRDPAMDRCHELFFSELEKKIADMAMEPISGEEAYDAILTLFTAPEKQSCPDTARWSLMAAHKTVLPLIPLLSSENRNALRLWYDTHIPRQERLPVQKAVYKALKA